MLFNFSIEQCLFRFQKDEIHKDYIFNTMIINNPKSQYLKMYFINVYIIHFIIFAIIKDLKLISVQKLK
jgi:hypothetical protein